MKLLSPAMQLALIAFGVTLAAPLLRADDAAAPYTLTDTWKIGGKGRWDYVICDAATHHLYVTRSNHTLVLNAATGATLADIPSGQGLHGTALAPDAGRGFISDGRGASVIVFDLKTNAVLGTVPALPDADCIIFDPASKSALTFCGEAGKMVVIPADVDVKTPPAATQVDLGGSPEYAATDGTGKVFVNINDKNEIAAIDTKTMTVTAHWPTGTGTAPTGLAIDPATHRLFIGCRNKKLVIMNSDTGAVVSECAIGAGNDAVAFDRGAALASCGDGTLIVVRELTADTFAPPVTVHTAAGARTLAVDHDTGKLYLPTAEFDPAPAPTADHPHPRPTPVPDSFKIIVLTPAKQ